jgi:dTDP-4-amino-4,6-dideoxygalactose transaminase
MILCANPSAQFQSHKAEIEAAVLKVLHGKRYVLGEEVEALEEEFARFIGTKEAIGVANGTDALELAIRSLDIGPGDEVITVSHTAVATVSAIEAAGAIPVLVDIHPDFFTLQANQLEEVLTPRTRAVIAVHLYGQAADLDSIEDFCVRNKLELIEDASQAHGATWKGRRLGSIGRIGCFSCYPTKNLGAIGDAGLITTNDESLALKLRMAREYGWSERYISISFGRNSRLDELQAAILRIKLRYLDVDNEKRRILANEYSRQLSKFSLELPLVRQHANHIYHLYTIRSQNRDKLINYLRSYDIHCGIHYPVPIHLQPAYKGRIRTAGNMHVTEKVASEILSLPIFPEMTQESLNYVTTQMRGFV